MPKLSFHRRKSWDLKDQIRNVRNRPTRIIIIIVIVIITIIIIVSIIITCDRPSLFLNVILSSEKKSGFWWESQCCCCYWKSYTWVWFSICYLILPRSPSFYVFSACISCYCFWSSSSSLSTSASRAMPTLSGVNLFWVDWGLGVLLNYFKSTLLFNPSTTLQFELRTMVLLLSVRSEPYVTDFLSDENSRAFFCI